MLSNCPRALIVDDQRDIAETFARVLDALGCRAEFVTDPRLAMDVVARVRPQVVFLDIGMPQMSGYELGHLLRERYGHDDLRLVAVTAYGSDEHRALSRSAGFDAHVVKPVSPELVESMLNTLFPETAVPAAPGPGGALPMLDSYALPPRTKVLLALSPDLVDRFQRILSRHELTVVSNSGQAMRALEGDFRMVVLGVHFDDSQMFALLADIRGHSRYRKIPVLCVLGTQTRLSDVAVEGLDHAVKAMRANGFLDLHHFADDQAGNARIARIVDYLILIDGDLQHIARATGDPTVAIDRRRREA